MRAILTTVLIAIGFTAQSETLSGEYLVKLENTSAVTQAQLRTQLPDGARIEALGIGNWVKVELPESTVFSLNADNFLNLKNVLAIEPNQPLRIYENPSLLKLKKSLAELFPNDDCPIPGMCNGDGGGGIGDIIGSSPKQDNPEIPNSSTPSTGEDKYLDKQWGMIDIGARNAWSSQKGRKDVVVAVIDTGVDYTHEDLVDNLWRNPGEVGKDDQGRDKSTNGVDDDGNGYVDDVIGWDFVSNDSKPFDLTSSMLQLFIGGNPGHGTHCAGNVAARGFNGKGISGVAPNVSIMSIRFIGEKGQGSVASAIKAIKYAVDNGAHILSNSWGSEGEDTTGDSQALKDAIAYAETEGRLFVAAAGNGRAGKGYDNDADAKPAYPASYDHDIIVSVAALDASGSLGAFSNWGASKVDIGAPGVKVFSTTSDGKYNDTVINLEFIGMTATWDGTSMATPHVAGAAALYLSQNPDATWREVKEALIKSATPIESMKGKSVSGGKLNVESLMTM